MYHKIKLLFIWRATNECLGGCNNWLVVFPLSLLRHCQEGLQWKTSSIVLYHCAHPPPIHPLLSLAASFRSQHDSYASALAAPLTSTLDQHHGEKTQKEINLAARAFAVWTQFRSFGLEMLCPNRWPWTRVFSCSWSNWRLTLLHNWKCSCFLCGHLCFWGCWWVSSHWWGWSQWEGPNQTLTTPPTRSPSLHPLTPTAPSWPLSWSSPLRWWNTVRRMFLCSLWYDFN